MVSPVLHPWQPPLLLLFPTFANMARILSYVETYIIPLMIWSLKEFSIGESILQ